MGLLDFSRSASAPGAIDPVQFDGLHPTTLQHVGAVLHGVGSAMLGQPAAIHPPAVQPHLHPGTLSRVGQMLHGIGTGQPVAFAVNPSLGQRFGAGLASAGADLLRQPNTGLMNLGGR